MGAPVGGREGLMVSSANSEGARGGPLQGGGGGGNGSAPAAMLAEGGRLSATAMALGHNPGLSLRWSPEEQTILEEGLTKYASDTIILRYANIAKQLDDKTVRDVALRCRWMTKKESGKRRKEDHNLSKKNKDKKERVADPTTKPSNQLGTRPNVPPSTLPMLPLDDDEISYKAIGGRAGQLLESNADSFTKISSNFANMKIQDNINIFCQTRENILAILKELNDIPEIMNQMPPLPVKINEELVSSILPTISMPTQSRIICTDAQRHGGKTRSHL